MTGIDMAIWITLAAEAILLPAVTLPAALAKPKPPAGISDEELQVRENTAERERGCAWLFLGFGLLFVGALALLALLPWSWAKITALVAALWLPASMLAKIAVGGTVDGIGRWLKWKPK